jgi:hypothetical protein
MVQHAPKRLSSFTFGEWGVGGFLDFLSSQSIWYSPFKFPMHPHHVPNGLPQCSASSRQVLQDVPNSTSFLSPTTFAQSCHLGSYIGGLKEQLLYFYLGSEIFYFKESPKFHFFSCDGPKNETHHQEKIWTWEAPTTKYSLSCVNGMSTHLLDKCLLKYQIAHICRVYQNCPFCGHNLVGYIYIYIYVYINKDYICISDACMYTISCGMFSKKVLWI